MYLQHLYPAPKSFAEDESRRFVFGVQVSARANGLSPDLADRVKTLWRRFSCDASELTLLPETDPSQPDGAVFRIGTEKAPRCARGTGTRSR